MEQSNLISVTNSFNNIIYLKQTVMTYGYTDNIDKLINYDKVLNKTFGLDVITTESLLEKISGNMGKLIDNLISLATKEMQKADKENAKIQETLSRMNSKSEFFDFGKKEKGLALYKELMSKKVSVVPLTEMKKFVRKHTVLVDDIDRICTSTEKDYINIIENLKKNKNERDDQSEIDTKYKKLINFFDSSFEITKKQIAPDIILEIDKGKTTVSKLELNKIFFSQVKQMNLFEAGYGDQGNYDTFKKSINTMYYEYAASRQFINAFWKDTVRNLGIIKQNYTPTITMNSNIESDWKKNKMDQMFDSSLLFFNNLISMFTLYCALSEVTLWASCLEPLFKVYEPMYKYF